MSICFISVRVYPSLIGRTLHYVIENSYFPRYRQLEIWRRLHEMNTLLTILILSYFKNFSIF